MQSGRETMAEICDELKRKTLEPAQQEAEKLIREATEEAEVILAKAAKEAEQMLKEGRAKVEQERAVFNASLSQAARQVVESLKQTIVHKLFPEQLGATLEKELSSTASIQAVVKALIAAVEKEGATTDLHAVVANTASPEEINAQLGKELLQRLEGKSVKLGPFAGGAELRVEKQRMTLEMTDQTVKELLGRYLHKGFRSWLFGE